MKTFCLLIVGLFVFCLSLQVQSQVVYTKSYDIEYDGFESTDVFEHEGHYYVASNDFSYLSESDLYGYLFRLSEDFTVIDTLEIDYEAIIGRSDMARGEFMVVNGQLEFVGVGSYRDDLTNGQLSLQDTTFFFRLGIADDFSISAIDKIPVSTFYYRLEDVIYDEAHEQYLFSVSGDFLFEYWIGSVNHDFTTAMRSESKEHPFGNIFYDNPLLVTKLILHEEAICLKINQVEMEVYNQALEFDSVFQIPQVDWSTPFYAWMSRGVKRIDDTYLQASSSLNRTHVLHLSLPGEFIQEFSIWHQDSVVTESLFKCLDINEDLDLFLGMHIRSEEEEYARNMKVVKCDTLGNVSWQSVFGEGLDVRYMHREIYCTSDGGVLMLANRYSDPSTDLADGLVLYKLSDTGEIVGVTELASPYTGIKLFPSPASDVVYLPLEFMGFEYQMIDMTGGVVLRGRISDSVMDVSGLNPGSYILNLVSGSKNYSQAFVVNR
jgi:hypothetical protein